MNPYKVLGVPPTASKAEIESAYERIVDTYSIQNFEDSDEKYLAEDKISEANEAFNMIINDMKYKEIRQLIETEQFVSAETELNLISDKTSPEWNYLKGFVMLKKGWVQSGVSHLKTAAELNPNNAEYSETMKILSKKINNMKQNYISAQAAKMQMQRQNQGNMNMCGGGPGGGGGDMCGNMGSMGNMMGGGNPLSSLMGGANPLSSMMGNAGGNAGGEGAASTPGANPMQNNPLQNMLLQNLMSGGMGGGNMCGSSGGGGMC